jgi:AGCS family alanine or glycine:cation symporter
VTGIDCWEDELTVTGPLDLITKKRQSQKHRDHLHGAQQ